MKRCWLMLLASVVWVTSAIGQVRPDEPDRPRRGPGEGRGPRMGRMLDRVADELQLDDAQRKEFDAIMAAHRAQMEEMAPRWREMREATRSGDRERADELRAQMGNEHGPRDFFRQAFDELEPILNDEQYERFLEMREGMERRRERREEFRRMAEELPDKLDMDEAQRKQFRQLLDSRRDRMRQQMTEMRPLFDQMREAEESGDQDRLQELRAQFEELRPDPETRRTEFLSQVSGLLREDQRRFLDDYYAELGLTSGAELLGPSDVRTVLRAARRIDLSSEQKAKLRTIGRQAMRDLRGVRRAASPSRLTDAERSTLRAAGVEGGKPLRNQLRRRYDEATAQLAAGTKAKIVKMLDEKQAGDFERRLQQSIRRDRKD